MLWSICFGISIGILVLVPSIASIWKAYGGGFIKRLSMFRSASARIRYALAYWKEA